MKCQSNSCLKKNWLKSCQFAVAESSHANNTSVPAGRVIVPDVCVAAPHGLGDLVSKVNIWYMPSELFRVIEVLWKHIIGALTMPSYI